MLTKLSIIKPLIMNCHKFSSIKKIKPINNENDRYDKAKNALTLQHIINAKNLSDLFRNIKINSIYSNQHFSLFMKKTTMFIIQLQQSSKSKQTRQILNEQEINYLQKYFYQLKTLTSPQLNSNASDLLIYQLFFKKMKDILGNKYETTGFQIRTAIISESLTNLVSMSGWQPISISLLHYMSTLTQSSKDNLKKKIGKYFLDYFVSKKINKSQEQINKIQDRNEQVQSQLEFQKQYNLADICSILLSCSQARLFKNTTQSKLNSISIFNVNKFTQQTSTQLNIKQLASVFKFILKNSQNPKICLQKIKQSIEADPFLKQINLNQKNLIVNNKIRFLQGIDIYLNIINKNYLKLWVFNEVQYKFIQIFTRYMYVIYYLCENMSIFVTNAMDNQQMRLNMQTFRRKQQIQQVKLWNISSKIVHHLSKNCIYVHNKQLLTSIILEKVVQYVKRNIHHNKNNKKTYTQISQNVSSIFNLITYMPIETLYRFYQKQPLLNQYLYELIDQCVNFMPEDVQTIKNVQKDIINLMKMKKTLIIKKQQWLNLLQKLINKIQNIKNQKQFQRSLGWNLYFFLASTEDPQLIKLIPFNNLVKKIVEYRNILQKKGAYKSFSTLLKQQKKQKIIFINQADILNILDECAKNRQWQLQLLKFHALLVFTQKLNMLQVISQLCDNKQGYKITKSQIQQLFSSWMRPYDERECIFFQISFLQLKSNKNFLDQYLFTFKHMPIYKIYFDQLFYQTQMPFQFKLINKILTHPTVENYLLYNQKYVKTNYLQYFLTVAIGLNDPINKKNYKINYSLNRILTNQSIQEKGEHDNHRSHQKCKEQLKTSFFQSKIFLLMPTFYQLEAWQFALQFLQYIQNVNQSKDVHLDVFIQGQQIYKTAFAELKVENDQRKNNFIQKFKQQCQVTSNKNKNNKNKQIELSEDQIKNIEKLFRRKKFDLNQQYNFNNIQIQQDKKINIENTMNIHKIIIKSLINELDPIKYQSVFLRRVTFILAYISQLSMSMIPKDLNSFLEQNKRKHIQAIAQMILQKQSKQKLINFLRKFIFRQEKCLGYLVFFLRLIGLLDKQICRQILKHQNNLDFINTPLICGSVLGRQEVIRQGYLTNEQYDKITQQIYKVSSIVKDSAILTYISILSVNSLQKLKKLAWAVKNTKSWKQKFILQELLKEKCQEQKIKFEDLYEIKMENQQDELILKDQNIPKISQIKSLNFQQQNQSNKQQNMKNKVKKLFLKQKVQTKTNKTQDTKKQNGLFSKKKIKK